DDFGSVHLRFVGVASRCRSKRKPSLPPPYWLRVLGCRPPAWNVQGLPYCAPITINHLCARRSWSRNGACPFKIFCRAASTPNHAALSTSGNSCCCPDFGGHSMENVLLFSLEGSKSERTAHANTSLPLGCLMGSKGIKSPPGATP